MARQGTGLWKSQRQRGDLVALSAATYSLNDLQRAQRADLVNPALLKLVQDPDLQKLKRRPWEAEMRELEAQIDADVRKLVAEFYNLWKDPVGKFTGHPLLQAQGF